MPDAPSLGGKDGGEAPGGPDGEGGDAGGDGPDDPEQDEAGVSLGGGNKARVLSVAPTYALAEETYKYHPKSNLSEPTTWKVEQGPAGVSVEDDGATISWTPSADQKGKHEIVLSAKVSGHELSQAGEITVAVADERASQEIDETVGGSLIVTAPKSRVAGASISVRPASLKGATRLTISEVDEAPAMGIAKDNTRAVKFGPSGTVFAEPALITLPLSEGVTNKSRVGAFVYDAKGRWVRVPVVDVDIEQGVVHAKAKHFSLFAAAESKLGLDISGKLAPSAGACVGSLFVDAFLEEPASQVDASVIGNLPGELAALSEGKSLSDFVQLDGLQGSLRIVRVVELAEGSGDKRVVLESKLLVTTLYLRGDGSAELTHTNALGRLLGSSFYGSVRQNLGSLWTHLSGRAVRAVFANVPETGVSVSARLHALFSLGDASQDPVNADDLGFALVDTDAVAISSPASDSRDADLDCDGLLKAYDGVDDRLMPGIALKPEGVSSGVVNSPVRLAAALVHASGAGQLSWQIVTGKASLREVAGAPNERELVAQEPGRFQVQVSAQISGQSLVGVFAIDVSPEAALPTCRPSPAVSTIKQGESLGLSAVLSDASRGESTLAVQWGLLATDGAFVSSGEIDGRGYEARLTPLYASRYLVACRAVQGARIGPMGSTSIDVVSAQQNLPPIDLTLSPGYDTLLVGASLSLTASARDPEDSALRFSWTSSGGTLTAPESQKQKSKASFSAAAPGLYEIRVAIRDQAELPQEVRAFVLVIAAAEDTDGADADRDGWPSKLDCDDQNAKVHPGAPDRCGDAIDDDCSGAAKQDDCDDDGVTVAAGDCNDANREVRPSAAERCDGIDNNCDGKSDEGFAIGGTCSAGRGVCERTARWVCSADGFGAVCPAIPVQPAPEVCDGVDNDCDGVLDEDFKSESVQCGLGVCQATGMTACVAGKVEKSCQPKPGAPSDLTCDGRDDDCNGQADEDVVRLIEVCNGRDDDCDGMIDESLSCGRAPAVTCVARGAEVCNGEDDDCNGRFDEGNVCGLSSDVSSLLGAFFGCENAACTALGNDGFMFLSNGQAIKLKTFQNSGYDPGNGPYCVDGPFHYQISGDQIGLVWEENKTQMSAAGSFVLAGAHLTLNFTSGPADMLGVAELVRVPEQAGGACHTGPVCQATEICGNGFDDDCDTRVDAADSECVAQCPAVRGPETCDGLDNDCNGPIDDLNQPCQRTDLFGVCRAGHLVCGQGGATICEGGLPETGGEVCSDGVDNDCDNLVDESGCAALTPGETCFNAVDITQGGTFTHEKGARNDVSGGCRPSSYVDRMFYLTTPSGLSTSYVFYLDAVSSLDVGGALYKMPAGYVPGLACPSITPNQGMCLSMRGAMQPYLDASSVYMLVVEAAPNSVTSGGSFTLSVGRSFDGSCTPNDADLDGMTTCAGDCNDARASTHPGASELCNQLDDDCDGLVDEQDGNCATGLPGACAVGFSDCNGTPACRPVNVSKADYCGDSVDNDCNGVVDDNCVSAAGESCDNAIELGNGGAFSGTLVGASDDAVSRCGGFGAERFYRFTVPAGGGNVRLRRASYPGSLRFSLYADCGLTPIRCDFMDANLEAGTYRLAVEANAANMLEAYAFTLGISVGDACLTPDVDGDGQVACYGDCDESRNTVSSSGVEGAACDAIDNDCNGGVDDLRATCTVPGLSGVCADGELRCAPQGGSSCVQTRFPDPQGRDVCADGIDNDCDGALDAQDPQTCVSLPVGETCGLAYQVDVSAGGTFQHTLAGYADDVPLGCGDYSMSGVERFYSLTLSQPRIVRFEAHAPYVAGDPGMVGAMLVTSCAVTAPGGTSPSCSGSNFQGELPAGTHIFAVFGAPNRNYQLTVSTQAPGDSTGTTCVPGDIDQDGFTLCQGDCLEGDGTVYQGAPEVCDGRDNNCNTMVDEILQPQTCTVAAAQGVCAQGQVMCNQGVPSCLGPQPTTELCNDGVDNDCDGISDEQGAGACMASGETCEEPFPIAPIGSFEGSLFGAAHNGQGCYGGVEGLAEERYYRFDVGQSGDYFVQVRPMGGGPFPDMSWGIHNSVCSTAMPNGGCVGPREGGRVVRFPLGAGPQYLVVESDDPLNYRITIASWIEVGTVCTQADNDGDGLTLCHYDCDDNDGAVHPGASDSNCDSVDNNCDGVIDEGCPR